MAKKNNSKNINIIMFGSTGKMGKAITKLIAHSNHFSDFTIKSNINSKTTDDKIISYLKSFDYKQDILIDFSHNQATKRLYDLLSLKKDQKSSFLIPSLKILIGTTGFDQIDLKKIKKLVDLRNDTVFFASNTSLGIMMMYKSVLLLSGIISDQNLKDSFDVELVETHHRYKKDAPSGTAKLFLQALNSKDHGTHPMDKKRTIGYVGVHALRAGGIYGDHSVSFVSDDEMITVSHRAISVKLFAKGALYLAKKLCYHNKVGFHDYNEIIKNFGSF